MVYVNIHKSLYLQNEKEKWQNGYIMVPRMISVCRLQCYYYYHGVAFAQNSVWASKQNNPNDDEAQQPPATHTHMK